jgi:endogenous inhibitor of DNA gyrase (YacG/DUF329 family)
MSEGKTEGGLKDARQPCRYCGKKLRATDPEHKRFWPFCSERCKMAELGMWFQDRYVVSRPVDEVADDAAATADKPPKKGGKR